MNKLIPIVCLSFVTLLAQSCGGGAKTDPVNEHPDKNTIDTIVMQNVQTQAWDTMFVKRSIKWNTEKNKYDTTDNYLKKGERP